MTKGRQRSSNTQRIGVPEEDKQNKGTELILKTIIQENFPKIKKVYVLENTY